MAHAYRVLAADLLTGLVREEIPFSTITYTHILNQPGTFTGTIGMRHPKATRANLDPGRTLIHVERDGVIVWSGILWVCRAQAQSVTLQCDAQDWWSYFRRRRLRVDKTYTNFDQTLLAQDLVNYAQGVAGGNIGVSVPASSSGVLVSATWAGADRQNIGQLVEALSAAGNGFDFAVDASYVSGAVVPVFNTFYPRRGSRTQQVLALAANLEQYEQDVDAGATANQLDVIGAGTGPSRLIVQAADTSQLAAYPLLEEVVQLTAITDIGVLSARAQTALSQMSTPLVTYPGVFSHSSPDTAIGSFRTGDSMLVSGSDGYIQGGSYQRIMSWSVALDDNGREQVSLTVVPEASGQ